jgi:hypothetical protein
VDAPDHDTPDHLLTGSVPGIVPVAVFLCDLPVLVVDNQFGLLVLADFACNVHGILFILSMLDCAFTAAYFDIPAAAFSGNYVMRFSHDCPILCKVI